MKNTMKVAKIALALMLMLAIPSAFAQTTGTITINGTVPVASSITNSTDTALSSTVALGTLTPTNTGTLTTGSVITHVRSNKNYVVSAQASALSIVGPGATAGGSDVTLSDIGFGITATDFTGANVAGSRTDTVVSLFDYAAGFPNAAAVAAANFLSPFAAASKATLNDVTSNTQLISGTRISAKGNNATNNNDAIVTFGVAMLPQYFTPNTSFSTTVTLTLTTP